MTAFEIFSSLPTEIRLKIWNHAAPGPRVVKVSYSSCLQRYISDCPPPIILHINQESRSEAMLKYHRLSLGIQDNPEIYVDLSIDTVYVSGLAHLRDYYLQPFMYELANSSDRHTIRKLAVDQRAWNDLCENGWIAKLCGMRSLVEVVMVIEFGRDFEGDIAFLQVPEWRTDLLFLERNAQSNLEEERRKMKVTWAAPNVRCMIMTKGGEQA